MVMPTSDRPKGVCCPRCSFPRMPTLYTRRAESATVRVRQCRRCGKKVRTREAVVAGPHHPHFPEDTR